jgi:hypothetical protein
MEAVMQRFTITVVRVTPKSPGVGRQVHRGTFSAIHEDKKTARKFYENLNLRVIKIVGPGDPNAFKVHDVCCNNVEIKNGL